MRFRAGQCRHCGPNLSENTVRSSMEPTYENPEPRLSVHLQLCVPGAGLLQPELPGEISAARDRRDPGAGLCRDARGLGAAVVLFLPAPRAATARGAAAFSPA